LVASWSPDGKRFVFGSQRDGIPEIYLGEVAAPGATPQALTSGPESALWAGFTSDGKSILFLRDSKGDGNYHIFRVAADGTGLTDLTPGEEMSRGVPVLPRAVPGLMLYSGSRVTDPSSTLFAQTITGGEPRPVFINPWPGEVLDVTADGSGALFSDIPSFGEMSLLEVDVASGKERRLYPAEGKKVRLFTVNYSHHGKLAYVTTDEGAESSILVAIDVKTGRDVGRYTNDSPKTAPMNAIVSPMGNRIAVHIDTGNHGEVRILNSKTLKVEHLVKVPLGFIQLGRFRDDAGIGAQSHVFSE
jgi:Tol biopolymer transport system component